MRCFSVVGRPVQQLSVLQRCLPSTGREERRHSDQGLADHPTIVATGTAVWT